MNDIINFVIKYLIRNIITQLQGKKTATKRFDDRRNVLNHERKKKAQQQQRLI